ISRDPDIIPGRVLRAWTNTALLFVGFQVDDWNFRVLFRSILNQQGRNLRKRKRTVNVAVQVDPEEAGRSLLPPSARAYLQKAFGEEDFTIYWGSSQQFIKELWAEWVQSGGRDRAYASARSD